MKTDEQVVKLLADIAQSLADIAAAVDAIRGDLLAARRADDERKRTEDNRAV